MKISKTARSKLEKYRDGPTLIVGIGPILDEMVIKRSVLRGTHPGGQHPLPDGVYNEALTGFAIRLYTHSPRRRDGVWILKKVEQVMAIERQRVPTKKGDKSLKNRAKRFARQIADEYGWVFKEDAKHNQEVPDLFQAMVELDEIAARE